MAGIDYAAAGFLNATIVDQIFGDDLQHRERSSARRWLDRPAGDDGRDHAHPAVPQHRRHQPRRAAQPGQRLVAHRHRGGGRRADRPHRQAGPVRADLFQIQPLDTAGSWNNNLGFVEPAVRAGVDLPGHPGLLLLAAPGELDLHRLRRLGPRGGGDGRRPRCRERLGRLPVGGRVGRRGLHLPGRPDDPPAGPLRRSSRPMLEQAGTRPPRASTTSAAGSRSSPSSTTTSATRSATSWRPASPMAMWFCGLASVAAAGRMLFAFSRDDGIPGSGWLKQVSHRYRTPANSLIAIVVVLVAVHRRGLHRRRRHRRSSSSPPSARSSCTPRTAS